MATWEDLYTHTTYSDGAPIETMVRTADAAGLPGIGLTDHCIVYDDPVGRSDRYDFEDTYRERRAEIKALLADVLPELPVEILPAEMVIEPGGRR